MGVQNALEEAGDKSGLVVKSGESADKPGSVVGDHSSGTHVAVRLKQPTRETRVDRACGPSPQFLYSALLRVGFTVPSPLPATRCALTTPFHPCLCPKAIGGLFSVALSVGSRPPGVTWHPRSMEPGLSSMP